MTFIITRNGEWLGKDADTYKEAEIILQQYKDADRDFVHEGWITQAQASQATWKIQKVSKKTVARWGW